ncbi:MAG: serine/threonine protein kinase [Xanthomonadales bacterium]|nr:serine/threonine protein kinase [Xanthomonadales bacterium]
MDAEKWQRARQLFDELADLPPEEWPRAMQDRGIDDPELREELLALLQADREDVIRTVVEDQAPHVLAELSDDDNEGEQQKLTGLNVGPFRLIEEIGKGGMGTVWLASRVDGEFEQKVAVKLIRSGWDAAEMLGRFRAERQILAHLNHPNIAHLIDGGVTADGRPWLALEYVDGSDLRSYCDERQLDLAARLKLFLTVCAAVSHAHAHLVVHRDLKPSNLLVTRDGEIKLLDFGIAKLIDSDASHASLQRVFTPEYAAPEQVRGEVMTTAVDVYALGLLLYELLTGKRPYKVKNSTPAAYERAILDQEPTRPSLAFTGLDDEEDLVARAAQREMSPQRLRRELRGDLDAIVLRALRKQPEQRYASVGDFAADIENHLHKRPVIARRGGWRYRSSRFLRRHAIAVVSVTLAAIALIGGLVVTLHQRNLARIEADKSERVLDFMVDNFRLANPAASDGAKITARELLDRGAQRISGELEQVPEAHAQLLETMGQAYAGIGDATESLKLYESALKLREGLDDPVSMANALLLKSSALKNLTRNTESAAVAKQARDLLPEFPTNDKGRAVEARILGMGAMHLFLAKNYVEAKADWTRMYEIQRDLYGPHDERTFDTTMLISRVLGSQGDADGSIAKIREVIEQLKRVQPPRKSQLLEAYNALGSAETKRERYDLAELADRESARLCLEVYGPDHWYVAIALNNLGRDLVSLNRHADAIDPLTESVRIARKVLPPTHGLLAASLKNLASAEFGTGNYAEAKRDYEAALEIHRQKPDTRGVAPAEIIERIKACDTALASAGKAKPA